MKARFFFLCLVVIFVSACVKAPAYKGPDHAFLNSSHAIININGKEVEPKYTLDLIAGKNTLVVLYATYKQRYHCEFVWTSTPGTAYEITDHEKLYPLTLYRWKKKNDLWSSRLDPVDPVKCTRENE